VPVLHRGAVADPRAACGVQEEMTSNKEIAASLAAEGADEHEVVETIEEDFM
jgi:hypothetical protein